MMRAVRFFNQTTYTTNNFTFINRAFILSLLFLLFSLSSFAQDKKEAKPFEHLLYIEADPFAYINKGYSIHLGYENWGMRFDLTKVKVDFPESFEEGFYATKAFDLVSNISGIKVDYTGNRSNWTQGAFAGLDINHQKLSFTHRETVLKKDLSAFNVGVRVGYKFNLWKGFYVTPWAAVWRNVNETQSFSVGDDVVTTNDWDWIATFHIGYAIKL